MDNTSYFIRLIANIRDEERDLLFEMAKSDKTIFEELLKKIVRLQTAVDTGNLAVWKKLLQEEEKNIVYFITELEDEQKIAALRKHLNVSL